MLLATRRPLAFCMEILPNQPDFSDLPAFIVGLLLLTCYNSRRGARCIYEFDEEKKEDAERLLSLCPLRSLEFPRLPRQSDFDCADV
jgi:hypothetical protein